MSKVHLVSFADGAFSARGDTFQREAAEIKIFDTIAVFKAAHLPADFLKLHGNYMFSSNRGFGYWIWKPMLVLEIFKKASNEDVVVYIDAGFTINKFGRGRMQEYIDITRCSPYRMLSFQNVHTEKMWTKMDLAERLCVHNRTDIMATSQLSSGFFVLQKTKSNIELISEWSRLSVENQYRYSDDTPSNLTNDSDFIEHRHDQSISSLLRKIRGTTITHYEVQNYEATFEKLRPTLPAWATRLRQ